MQSIEEIYKQYANIVYRYLMSLVGDVDLAQELTQETFYQAIRTSHRYDGVCKVSTWLCGIAKNVLLTYRRKNRQWDSLDDVEIAVASAEKEAVASVGRMELLKKIHNLSEPYREVLYLRTYGDLSFREIGEIYGKSENWARVTFYRGKEHLRKEVDKDE